MSLILYDVELWHEYASQMRALAKSMADPRMRQRMLAAAAGFERIAELAKKLQDAPEKRRRWNWAA